MKKKLIIGIVGFVLLAVLTSATVVKHIRVKDNNCNKCVVTSVDRECGQCGGFLNEEKNTVDGKYLVTDYKCGKCGHKCTFKVKY